MSRHWLRDPALSAYAALYQHIASPLIFRSSPEQAHEHVLRLGAALDSSALAQTVLNTVRRLTTSEQPVTVGGVHLPSPFMLAAGFVKGAGFATEADALTAVQRGENIMPGWRAVPSLVGTVEFGSFTRFPRMGNAGRVVWRDASTRSLQNRVGLKNPGAAAAAEFLAAHRELLPSVFGINIAVSPGVTDSAQARDELQGAVAAFLTRGVVPSWCTLNVSCPNTEDDPGSHQTAANTSSLCEVLLDELRPAAVPLWVKVSPALASQQYDTLMQVFHALGVQAVIATNTLPQPTPDDAAFTAGASGGKLHQAALSAVAHLSQAKARLNAQVDIIGCGGILDPASYDAFAAHGCRAMQYWSALIYLGPLAPALLSRAASTAPD